MKNVLLLLFLFCFQSAFSQKYKGDSWATVKTVGSGTLTVMYYEQPGLIDEEGGKVKGACVDILTDFVAFVQKKYDKKITVSYAGKEPVFTDFLKIAQETKDILGVTNVTITEDRKKILKFTPPFLSNPVVLLTHKDAPNVVSLSEIGTKLDGYSAEIIGGSTHAKHISKIKKEYMPSLSITYGANGAGDLEKDQYQS